MSHRELLLLSPHRLPTTKPLELSAEEMASFLNGYAALWHPAVLAGASEPPKIIDAAAGQEPVSSQLFAMTQGPFPSLPEDWPERVKQAGAVRFSAGPDRKETFRQLADALQTPIEEDEAARPFFGLGLGYLILHALAEAMNHLQPLSTADFWSDVQRAAASTDSDARQEALAAAAQKLKEAREVLYPSTIHVVEFLHVTEPALKEHGFPGWAMLAKGHPILDGKTLSLLADRQPELLQSWKEALEQQRIELCGGAWDEEDSSLLPITEQVDRLRQGLALFERHLGERPKTYGGPAATLSPITPALLLALDVKSALGFPLGGTSTVPSFKGPLVEWPSPHGPSITILARKPTSIDQAAAIFQLVPRLHQTIMEDYSAILTHMTEGQPCDAYADWTALHRLGNIFGEAVFLSDYIANSYASEHPTTLPADDFLTNALHDVSEQGQDDPISRWAIRQQQQLKKDVQEVWPALLCAAGQREETGSTASTATTPHDMASAPSDALDAAAAALAQRLLASATANQPGFMILNPLGMTRKVAVDLPGATTPMPPPAKASHVEASQTTAIVELPPFGFAWLPRAISPGTKILQPKMPLVQQWTLRNEYLEAEIDPTTGGLKEIRDQHRKIGRMGLQLAFARGGTMRAEQVRVATVNPVVAAIESTGFLHDEHDHQLASFKIEYRLWWSRPFLDLQVELTPSHPPGGHSWNDYFALRLAWRDASAELKRNCGWTAQTVGGRQFEATRWIEWLVGPTRTLLLTSSLPFAQRIGPRMLDVLLIAGHEKERHFRAALACEMEQPDQAWWDWAQPAAVAPVDRGPSAIGPSAWLMQVDRPNLVVLQVRPASKPNAVQLLIAETLGVYTSGKLLCCRDPKRASVINAWGREQQDLAVRGDAVSLELSGWECQWVQVEWD